MLGDSVGVSAVLAAMLGLSVLLLTGVLTWKDCLTYPAAWDTLFWFAILVGAPSLPFLQAVVRPIGRPLGGHCCNQLWVVPEKPRDSATRGRDT